MEVKVQKSQIEARRKIITLTDPNPDREAVLLLEVAGLRKRVGLDLLTVVAAATHPAVLLHEVVVGLSIVHQNRYLKQSRLRTTNRTPYQRALS